MIKSNLDKKLLRHKKLSSLGLMTGGFVHELNSPLGAIILYAQMLQKKQPEDTLHLTEIQEIEKAALRCKSLIEDLLSFLHEENRGGNSRAQVNPHEAMTHALRLGRLFEAAKDIEVTTELCPLDKAVTSSKDTLIQIFFNVIQNSIQSMPEGGELRVSGKILSDPPNQIEYTISDTGEGIDPQRLKRVFEPFYTTKKVGVGTGLGLYITKQLCDEIGATINLTNHQMQGTLCSIRIPIDK